MGITRVLGPDGEPLSGSNEVVASPGGGKLAFPSVDGAELGFVYDLAADEATAVPLPDALDDGRTDVVVALSPAGEAFAVRTRGGFREPDELAVVDADGRVIPILADDSNLQGVPLFVGEDRLAYAEFTFRSGVDNGTRIVDLETGEEIEVALDLDETSSFLFDVSADGGTLIVQGRDEEEQFTLYAYDTASREARPLDFDGFDLDLSADGSTLAYVSRGDRQLEALDLETGATERLTQRSLSFNSDPVVSEDGRFVAFGDRDTGASPLAPTPTPTLNLVDRATGEELVAEFPSLGVSNPFFTISPYAVSFLDDAPVAVVRGFGGTFRVDFDLIANPDGFSVSANTPAGLDVLADDVDFGDDGLTLVSAEGASNGSVAVEGGEVVYTPDAGFAGEDSFSYTVRDGAGNEDEAEVLVLVQSPPSGEPIVITTDQDVVDASDGELSIREAVELANLREGEDTIAFADELAGATIELRGLEDGETRGLVVADDLVIDGDPGDGGAEGVTIVDPIRPDSDGDYDGGIRVLSVVGAELSLEDLTIGGGDTGVYARGATLTAERVLIDDVGAFGSATGVEAQGSTVRLVDSTIERTNGYYESSDQAIRATNGSDVTLLRSAVTNNGGGYYGTTVEIEGRLRIEDSTVANNRVERGSDVIGVRGDLEMINSTVTGNSIDSYSYREAGSGLIRLDGGAGSVLNSTIAGNRIEGGYSVDVGTFVLGEGVTLDVGNSILVGNELRSNNSTAAEAVGPGALASAGNNVFGDNPFAGAQASDVTGAALEGVFAEVVPGDYSGPSRPVLADNGGPTLTAALLDDPANPALGQADPATAPAADQRGFERDAEPDAGAFEAGAEGGVSPPPPPPEPLSLVVTTADDVVAVDGLTSLREAVGRANVNPGEDTITFADGLDEVVLERNLASTDDLVIDGDAGDSGRGAFTIRSEVDLTPGYGSGSGSDLLARSSSLRLEDLTLERQTPVFGYLTTTRAGVRGEDADLVLERAAITGGASRTDIGVELSGGSLLMEESSITDLTGRDTVAGVFADDADVRLVRSEISDILVVDRSGDRGPDLAVGVLSRGEGRLEVEDSEVAAHASNDNTAFAVSGADEVLLLNSTLQADTGFGDVAAIRMLARGELEAVNSTLTVTGSIDPRGDAAAVRLDNFAAASLTNVTASAVAIGGQGELRGLALRPESSVEVANSVVRGPVELQGGAFATSLGGNVFTTDPAFALASDATGVDARDVFVVLDDRGRLVLGDYGGPTPTAALRPFPDNPAIGRAVPELAPAVDQRGLNRDAEPDAGAFEVVIGDEPDPEGFEVTTTFDLVAEDGELSLREAVARANATAGEDTITFAEGLSQVVVEGGGFEVTDALVVDGGGTGRVGQGGVTVTHADGRDSDAVLFESDGDDLSLLDVRFENFGALADVRAADLRLINASAYYSGADGRALVAIDGGALTAQDFSVYEVYGAAAVQASDATLLFEDVSVYRVVGDNARVLELRDTDLTASDSFFGGAFFGAGTTGAAVRAYGGSVTLSDGTDIGITGGPALVATGGTAVTLTDAGLYQTLVQGPTVEGYDSVVFVEGSLSIDRSLFESNQLPTGGSLVEVDGTLEMVNSTLTNDLPAGFNDPGSDGVVLTSGSEGTITNSTIAGNFGTIDGGFAVVVEDGADLRLENSLIAANGTQAGGPSNDVRGVIESNGGNVFGQEAVEGAAAGDVLGADERLIFADFNREGLPTLRPADPENPRTLDLLASPDNPAIDRAVPEDAPPVDQRGLPRDAEPDAGAFEVQEAVSPPPPPPPPGGDALTVTFLSEDAEFDNSLGYYFKDESGNPTGGAGILFEEATEDALSPGDSVTLQGVTEGEVGFFLVRDGANLGLDFDAALEVQGERLLIGDVLLKDYQVQFDFDPGQLIVEEGEGGALLQLWEDKALSEGSYDGDFDDAVFEVCFETGADEAGA